MCGCVVRVVLSGTGQQELMCPFLYLVPTGCREALKGRHSSGDKGNFESGQNKRKACSYILEDRQCNPLFVIMDTSCKLNLKKGQYFAATYQQQLSRPQTTVSTLNRELCVTKVLLCLLTISTDTDHKRHLDKTCRQRTLAAGRHWSGSH